MADAEKKLLFVIGASTKDFNKAIGDVDRQFKMTLGNITKAAGGLLPALSVGAVVYGFADMMNSATAYGEQIMLAAEKTGLGTDMLQDLNFLAKTTNSSMEGLEVGIKKMNTVISDGIEGNKTAADTLQKLGLSVSEVAGMNSDQRFKAIAIAISQIEDPAIKSALAVDVFGKAGSDLIPLINALKDIDKVKPPKLSEADLKSLADAKDATEKMSAAWENLKNRFAATVLPNIVPLVDALSQAINKVNELSVALGQLNTSTGGASSPILRLLFPMWGMLIPKTAEGGIVSTPQIRMIGEAGPEAVIPLDRLRDVTPQGASVTVNVGNYMGDELSKRALVRDIQRILNEENRRSVTPNTQTSFYSVGGHL